MVAPFVKTGSCCSKDLDFDVRNACTKLLWSKNQRLQICILGACTLVGKGQMLWSQKAAAKPSKFRCRKETKWDASLLQAVAKTNE